MEKIIRNELLGYIIPSFSNEDLGNFSLTSTGCRELAIGEISRRALENKSWFEAVVVLNKKICSSVGIDTNPLIKKVQNLIDSFETNSPNFFSDAFTEKIWKFTMQELENLGHVGNGINFVRFCSGLRVDEKKPTLILHCITILEKYGIEKKDVSGDYPAIEIDTSYPTLSVGNLACLAIAQKKLTSTKQELLNTPECYLFFPLALHK